MCSVCSEFDPFCCEELEGPEPDCTTCVPACLGGSIDPSCQACLNFCFSGENRNLRGVVDTKGSTKESMYLKAKIASLIKEDLSHDDLKAKLSNLLD